MMTRRLVLLAVTSLLGAVLLAVGVGMIYFPAGFVAGGLLVLLGAYIGAYLSAKA